MKRITIVAALLAAFTLSANAQEEEQKFEYRRSSLATIMLDTHDGTLEEKPEIKKVVVDTYNAKPTPDKYNDHNIDIRSIDVNSLPTATADEIKAVDEKKKDAEFVARLMKYFAKEHVANKLIAKWFEVTPEKNEAGEHYTINLITERGLAGFTAEEVAAAKQAKGGENNLINGALEDLVPRTFIAVTRYSFTSAEEIMAIVLNPVIINNLTSSNALLQKAAEIAIAKFKKAYQGYFVTTKTYLFQLDWNMETTFPAFESYMGKGDVAGFMNSDEFKIKYVGTTSKFAPACMTLSFDDKSAALIERATLRSTDAVIAKLQKEYDVFKTLAPIYVEGNEITALIGMNEGVEPGDKFEVLELRIDPKTGKMAEPKVVQKISAIKGKIWDNRAGAEAEAAEKGVKEGEENAATLGKTYFKGNAKKLMPGMFIRQVK